MLGADVAESLPRAQEIAQIRSEPETVVIVTQVDDRRIVDAFPRIERQEISVVKAEKRKRGLPHGTLVRHLADPRICRPCADRRRVIAEVRQRPDSRASENTRLLRYNQFEPLERITHGLEHVSAVKGRRTVYKQCS